MDTVAIYLGAHRSLTTISSAMMALHPEVMVLNHAYGRIFADPSRDFLRTPTPETLEAFTRTAAEMSLGGEQGNFGGHILHSHAFKADDELREAYLEKYGWDAKPAAKCLLWKDATSVTNHIGNERLDVGAAARSLPSLRFVAMVRNPVDITISSIRKGYSRSLVSAEKKDDFREVFVQMIRRFAWFSVHAAQQPGQFRFVFQDELLDRANLIRLCDYLRISAPESWLDDVARLVRLRESYAIPNDAKAELKAMVMRLIPDAPTAQRVADQIV